jgi:hypothetical protein
VLRSVVITLLGSRVRRSVVAMVLGLSMGNAAVQAATADESGTKTAQRAFLDQYCISCHNRYTKTADLMLDDANVDDVGQQPELWEKVITKLSLRAMPPVEFPVRPDAADYSQMLSYLTRETGRLASNSVRAGSPVVHRLNRTEYTNAVRDLLALEIDGSQYLPADNIAEGFDNIAEALSMSPLLMEQYMFAAGRIARLAVGTGTARPSSETFTTAEEFLQNERASEDLPFGSRGGMAVRHYFPADGEYTLRVRLIRNLEGYIRGMERKHLVDVRMDHERLDLFEVGGETHGRTGPAFTDSNNVDFAGDDDQVGYEFSADKDMIVRFNATAGTHLLGATFLDDGIVETGFVAPELVRADIPSYKGGDPGILGLTVTGPFNAEQAADTPSRERIFTCRPEGRHDDICAESILKRLARRAYRRPVAEEETASLMRLYKKGEENGGFETGIELALQGILAGPEFLFRIEQGPPAEMLASGATVYPLSDIDLASRLSFFLWSSIPDEELLSVAEQGELKNPEVLRQQVRRMVADERFGEFIDNFGSQWLALRNLDLAQPQSEIFPEFDGELRVAMRQEMMLWFESMVREDRSVRDMLDADFTFVNERLARFYGIPDVYGSNFRRVTLDNTLRHGMLGKASLLTVTSFNNRTSPVVRGNWVLEHMLDMAPPPPPADAFQPELVQADETGRVLTMKESMEKHRTNPVCANCHRMMEPIGLALETFDGIGHFRTRYVEANAEVDASGTLFDNTPFNDTHEFRELMMKYSDRFVETVTKKLMIYALSRALDHNDQPVVREIVTNARDADHTWSSLILGIVESVPFQYRDLSHDHI